MRYEILRNLFLRRTGIWPMFLATEKWSVIYACNGQKSRASRWIETGLRCKHPDLTALRFTVQSLYGPPDRIAFVVVDGIDGDRTRRRQIRAEANDLLRRLGYCVEPEPGRDVYEVTSTRPVSAHEELQMLQRVQAATGGTED